MRGLILAAGNPVREDDGLGPAAATALQELIDVNVECGYQFNVEDAATVALSSWVVFVDALADDGDDPWRMERITPASAQGYTSHSVSPEQVVGLAGEVYGADPEAWTLGIRGYSWEMFHAGLTPGAQQNLDLALAHLREWVGDRCLAGES